MTAMDRRSERKVSAFDFHLCDLVCGLKVVGDGLKLCRLSSDGLRESSLSRRVAILVLGDCGSKYVGRRYVMFTHLLIIHLA